MSIFDVLKYIHFNIKRRKQYYGKRICTFTNIKRKRSVVRPLVGVGRRKQGSLYEYSSPMRPVKKVGRRLSLIISVRGM